MCRCTQNTWVQHANQLVGIVGTDKICTAFDEKDVVGRSGPGRRVDAKSEETVCEGECGGVEHFEDGGGVLIGEGLGGWK